MRTLNEYIKHYQNKIETIKGSGRKKQKGGNVIFFNKPKELIKKLDLIVGEIHCTKKRIYTKFAQSKYNANIYLL